MVTTVTGSQLLSNSRAGARSATRCAPSSIFELIINVRSRHSHRHEPPSRNSSCFLIKLNERESVLTVLTLM